MEVWRSGEKIGAEAEGRGVRVRLRGEVEEEEGSEEEGSSIDRGEKVGV